MPGNEVDDRVHNFFQQDNFSQSQHDTQAVEGHWAVLNNNLWVGNERQIAGAFNSKSYNLQQSDGGRGLGNQFSQGPYGSNFTQNNVRPELAKSQSQNQQLSLNGFMHASQVSCAGQNEANVSGRDMESDRHNLMARGLHGLELQHRSGPQHNNTNSASFGAMEATGNFDFLGGQQQMSNQQAGMLQSLQRQQSGISDTQLFRQQVMLRQMQELQRQQHLQQLDTMQRNSVNQISTFPTQVGGSHSPAFTNDIPMHDGANYPWPSQAMTGNTNWLQRGVSAGAQGYSNGVMITPEQGQALRFMGLMPQQASQSLYGVPVSSTRAASPFLHNQIDKHQVPFQSSSLSRSPHALFPEQVGMQEGSMLPRPGFENKSSFEHASGHASGNLVNVENFNEVQQKDVALAEYRGRQDVAGSSESLSEKIEKQVASSQAAVALDPTEEKILFGSDDNIWEAFGGSLTSGIEGHNVLDGAFPSLQSGSWSALMQSAVAESSSNDLGLQGEWGGVGLQKSISVMGNQQPSIFHDSGKQEAASLDSSQAATLNYRPFPNDAGFVANYHTSLGIQQSFSDQPRRSLQTRSSQQSEEGRKWLGHSQSQMPAEGSQVPENAHSSAELNSRGIAGLWSHQQNRSLHGSQPSNGPNGLNFIESVPQNGETTSRKQDNLHGRDCGEDSSTNMGQGGVTSRLDSFCNPNVQMGSPKSNAKDEAALHNSSNIKVDQEPSQKPSENHQFNFWRSVGSSMKSGNDASKKSQQQLSKGHHLLEPSVNSFDRGAGELHAAGTADKNENSGDSHGSDLSHHVPSGGLRESVWSDSGETRGLSRGTQKSSCDVGRKMPAPRKFQYHPMGDLDMDVEPAYGAKHSMQSQAMNHPLSGGFTSHEGQLRFLHPIANNSLDSEGLVSNIHGDINMPYGVSPSSIRPGYGSGASAFHDKSAGFPASHKPVPSSQNMLELLHKVDQSKEQNSMGQFNPNRLSGIREAEASDQMVGLGAKQLSASQSFGLQLAPPSQGLPVPNFMMASQNMSQNVNSPRSNTVQSDRRDKVHWLAPAASVQASPLLHETPQGESRNIQSGIPGQTDAGASPGNMQGNFLSPASGSLYLRSLLQNQHMTDAGGKIISEQPGHVPFGKVSHGKPIGDSQDQAHSAQVSVSCAASSVVSNDLVPQKEIAQLTSVNQSDARVSMHQSSLMDGLATPQPSFMYGMSQRGNLLPMVPSVPANITPVQPMFGAQAYNASDLLKSRFQSNHFSEANLCAQRKQDDQEALRKGNAANSQGVASGDEQPARETDLDQNVASESQGKGSFITQDDSLPKSAATPKDIEAFGRSLRPNSNLHDNYSLLHQMQAMKSTEMDHGDRQLKRFKGPDNDPDVQEIAARAGQIFSGELNCMARKASVSSALVLSGDAKMMNLSAGPGNDQDETAPLQILQGNVASQDMFSHGHGDSQNFSGNDVTTRVEHPHISAQMAPSWFEQYGTFRNGQLLAMQDARRSQTVTSLGQQLIISKSSKNMVPDHLVEHANAAIDTGQMTNARKMTTTSVLGDQVSSHPLVCGGMTPIAASLRPKKRKSVTADLLPWHKEVAFGLRWLQNMSSAEAEWAQSANRLIEKADDDTDMNEDVLPISRSKRRLTLTTQLMQQVLRPPPMPILSLDASSNYETVAYFVARLALGDACSLMCSLESDLSSDSGNSMSEKLKTCGKIRDQYFSEVVEDFVSRARKLEDDLLSLDKRGSMLDLRLECQDLERFSVINRFAKFHGRAQVDGAETSSSSGTIATGQRLFPQRYVTAHPVPRNLPDGVQCLSL
ncbi:hypothetical protein Ancab_036024 [Ancistrocladus abbreviatus]